MSDLVMPCMDDFVPMFEDWGTHRKATYISFFVLILSGTLTLGGLVVSQRFLSALRAFFSHLYHAHRALKSAYFLVVCMDAACSLWESQACSSSGPPIRALVPIARMD